MDDIDLTYRVLDSTGGLVLDLNAGGFTVVEADEEGVAWDRRLTSSPWVDGDAEDAARRTSLTRGLVVRIEAASWSEVESMRRDLSDAVSARSWLLEQYVEGVSTVWRAGRADSSSPVGTVDILNKSREVSLRIPVQPSPSISGVG